MIKVAVQAESFNVAAEQAELLAKCSQVGALAAFTGIVRQDRDDSKTVKSLFLQHYPGMTEKYIHHSVEKVAKRFHLLGCIVIHRVGVLRAGEPIVFVLSAASHRKGALAATEFLIDWLKTEVPIWKKHNFTDGSEEWLSPHDGDKKITQEWKKDFLSGHS